MLVNVLKSAKKKPNLDLYLKQPDFKVPESLTIALVS